MEQCMKLWKIIALTMAITLLAAILISNSIREGQTMYYYSDVESGANYLEVDLVSRQPYNVVRYISYVSHIQLEGIKHEEIHRDAN